MSRTFPTIGKTTTAVTPVVPKKIPAKKVYTYSSKPTVIISKEFLEKIKYLCEKISTIEWSGILLYSVEGTMDNLKELTIYPKDILLMDIGSTAHTSFDYDPVIISNGYIDNPEWLDNEYRRGMIHSHNTMGVFFSGEDMSELNDNAHFYDFYLSIIVNNKLEITGKIAFVGNVDKRTEIKTTYTNSNRELKELVSKEEIKEEVMFTADCTIERPQESPVVIEYFDKRISEIKAAQASKNRGYAGYGKPYKGGAYWKDEFNFRDYTDYEYTPPVNKYTSLTVNKESKKIDIKSYIKGCFENYDFGEVVYHVFDKLVIKLDDELKTRVEVFADEDLSEENIIEDFFDEAMSPSLIDYTDPIFKAYEQHINKHANWSTNITRTSFIEFVEEVIVFLDSYKRVDGEESIIVPALTKYLKEFIATDSRLDHIKYKI